MVGGLVDHGGRHRVIRAAYTGSLMGSIIMCGKYHECFDFVRGGKKREKSGGGGELAE